MKKIIVVFGLTSLITLYGSAAIDSQAVSTLETENKPTQLETKFDTRTHWLLGLARK
ncbi:MAG: hypothetical protein AAF652_06750 [Cyanobacteria bacterium P01_C01_bin.72]